MRNDEILKDLERKFGICVTQIQYYREERYVQMLTVHTTNTMYFQLHIFLYQQYQYILEVVLGVVCLTIEETAFFTTIKSFGIFKPAKKIANKNII